MSIQNSYPFHEGGYQGRSQVRGGRRGDYGDNPNVAQAYHGGYYGNQQGDKALEKIKWKVPPNVFLEVWSLNLKHQPTRVGQRNMHLAFKDHSKPKVEKRGRLTTNPTRGFKCNGVGHIAINCPMKRTFVFSEDLNGWIEKSNDDFQEEKEKKSLGVNSKVKFRYRTVPELVSQVAPTKPKLALKKLFNLTIKIFLKKEWKIRIPY
ncbi:hypothetical protein M9H77_02458 [Catharanthus roseus]|uniref:Uncharacterized protein n=1 Tax=Catharanthus roseus TaxID=4058 RepID=A0ACC0C8H9_CATRO|nr:hypothetical protein M9H77_02458 [Catharanthus roseus]